MLRRLANATGILDRLRAAWRQDVHDATEPLRNEVRRLGRRLEQLEVGLQDSAVRAARGDQNAAQVKFAFLLNEQQQEQIARLPVLLDSSRINAQVREAVAAAPLETEPYEHAVVERVLPDDVYQLLLDAIPPSAFFGQHDPIKQDLPLPMDFGPILAARVWNFVDDEIAQKVLRPAVMEKFHEPLQRHYDTIFGVSFRERAHGLPAATSGGRLMLRRPGYVLAPHRDPKRSLLTCLLYLARSGDSDTYGTGLYRVMADSEAGYKQTYYPEREGHRCELIKVVPFRPNTMLVFLNSRGAHGAQIPKDAPVGLERYAYQFYVAPRAEALAALIKALPRERRALWRSGQSAGSASA